MCRLVRVCVLLFVFVSLCVCVCVFVCANMHEYARCEVLQAINSDSIFIRCLNRFVQYSIPSTHYPISTQYSV